MTIQLKRAYDDAEKKDGLRVLIDRLWPRGVSKEKLQLDEWLKEIGPSSSLRKWFNHDPAKFKEFRKKYKDELTFGEQKEQLEELRKWAEKVNLTLIYAAKDEEHNHAQVLKEVLENTSNR